MAKKPAKRVEEQIEVTGAEDPAYQFNRGVHTKATAYCADMRLKKWYENLCEKNKPALDAAMEKAGLGDYVLKNGDRVTLDVSEKRTLSVKLVKGEDGKMEKPIDVEEIDVG